ncbi:MAG: hypothetical protein GY936_09790 [Ignavibacteriae bacterium]|nr:hypothetical protein [Ignavibacteriota bacterium]
MTTIKDSPRVFFSIIYLVFFIFVQCTKNPVEQTPFNSFEVDIRMEVQILDSTYHLYSIPHTKIYFTTYKLQSDSSITDFNQSDTTSCPNGWGVKLLNFTLNSKKEKIILGAACENYSGENYRQIEITYSELEQSIDTSNKANINKTIAIYYN